MSYKPDEKDWMAYLYGELGDDEKRKFDLYLLHNPEARLELDKFTNLRGLLSLVEEKEVIAPPIVIGDHHSGKASARQHFWHTSFFRAVTTVAASLLLVILVGKLTGTQLAISGNEMRLTFGTPPPPAPIQTTMVSSLTEDEVREMINTSLERNNTQVRASLEETQKKLDASIRSSLALSSGKLDQLVRQASTASQDEIRQFAETIRAENMQQVKDYFQLTSTEQKNYIENLLVHFAKYLQQQRNDDLQLVQTRMNSLEQNTVMFKQETEQILANIITTVGSPVSGETKN